MALRPYAAPAELPRGRPRGSQQRLSARAAKGVILRLPAAAAAAAAGQRLQLMRRVGTHALRRRAVCPVVAVAAVAMALNAMIMSDSSVAELPKGGTLRQPVCLAHSSTDSGLFFAIHYRWMTELLMGGPEAANVQPVRSRQRQRLTN